MKEAGAELSRPALYLYETLKLRLKHAHQPMTILLCSFFFSLTNQQESS
jgi:hypothetical protein